MLSDSAFGSPKGKWRAGKWQTDGNADWCLQFWHMHEVAAQCMLVCSFRNTWIKVEKKLLCQPPTSPGGPTSCINSKQCNPDGVQCAESCDASHLYYDNNLRDHLRLQYDESELEQGPRNWAEGKKAPSDTLGARVQV